MTCGLPRKTAPSCVQHFRLTQLMRPAPVFVGQFFEGRLETTYAHDARLDLWVPRTMTEEYGLSRADNLELGEGISSMMAYSNFRRFETSGRLVN